MNLIKRFLKWYLDFDCDAPIDSPKSLGVGILNAMKISIPVLIIIGVTICCIFN